MKKLLLLLTLVCVSVSFARPSTISGIQFTGAFGGANSDSVPTDNVYTVPTGTQGWAGFANEDQSIYPLILESGATITFDAELLTATPVNVRIVLERLPYDMGWNGSEFVFNGSQAAATLPKHDTGSVSISGVGTNSYSFTVDSYAAEGLIPGSTNTFSSFLLYLNEDGQAGSVSNSVMIENFVITGLDDGDTTAPTPNPMTFADEPEGTSDNSITMTATTATDDSAVQYYFTCTTDSQYDSGWVTSPTYTVNDLSAEQTLAFTVQARDDSYAENAGTASAVFSATTTGSDSTPPSPNPLTATTSVSSSSLLITAATATDASPVEYRFVNTSGNADSSEWQTSNVYLVEGLSASTAYTYEVIARDLSAATNTTTAAAYTMTTLAAETEENISESLTDRSGNTTEAAIRHSLLSDGLEVYDSSTDKAVTFDSNGASFAGSGNAGRSLISTLANNWDSTDFIAEVTVVIESGADQQAVFGIAGSPTLGHYDLPAWGELGGTYIMQLQDSDFATIANNQFGGAVYGSPNPGSFYLDDLWNPEADAVSSDFSGTSRLRLENDATAGEFTFSVHQNYSGGDFAASLVRTSVDHDVIWDPNVFPTQNGNYNTDEEVYVQGGQTPLDTLWGTAAGGGEGAVFSFPTTGGSGDDGGYFQIDSSAGSWAVGVVSSDGRDDTANSEYPISTWEFESLHLITFQMDMKQFSESAGELGGIKLEFRNDAGEYLGQVDMGWGYGWPELKKTITTEWETYRWMITVPDGSTTLKVVPVQHGDVTIGYDNLAFIPNPSYTPESNCRILIGGDDGVVFKDLSISIDGGSVSVDPFSISSISSITGGSVITWTAQSGVTYEVQYKTSLVGGSWETTVSAVTGDGSVSATSDVDAASAFFRVIGQ